MVLCRSHCGGHDRWPRGWSQPTFLSWVAFFATSRTPSTSPFVALCQQPAGCACILRLSLAGGRWAGSPFLICLALRALSVMAEQDVESELLDYEEDEEPQAPPESSPIPPKKDVKGSYVSIHSSGFRDFLLRPELLRAIVDCGFEHPSEGMLPWSPRLPTVVP